MEFGTTFSLWRYPVKSLTGEQLTKLEIDSRGISGDRSFAVSNEAGKFGSGKNTRRFKRINGLSALSARAIKNGVAIKFPDGETLTNEDKSIHDKLSQNLGLNVTLNRENKISHFDDGPIHILTTASLRLLAKELPSSGIDVKRFRPNIVIDTEHFEYKYVGRVISIGSVKLEISHRTERCRMVAMEQEELEYRPEILKYISKKCDLNFGVYARVLSVGSVSVGDEVSIV